jgi:hypothetical protein
MKKLKVTFCQALIPAIAGIIFTLVITICLSTLNTANANSSDLQDNPLPFLPPFQSQLQPSQQQHQQDMNHPTQKQPLHTNEMNDSHNNKFDNRSPTVVSIMPF